MRTKSILLLAMALTAVPLFARGIREPEPAQPAATSVTITDVVGRTVTLQRPAARIVGTHNPTMNIAVILGGGGKYIVGFGNKNMAGGLYGYVFPELGPLPQIGTGREVNFESCLHVGADLAILPERFANVAGQFENVGIPAAVILPNSESFDSIRNSITLLGTLLGEDERAARINAFFDGKIAAARAVAARANSAPRILYLGGSNMLSVANGLMLQSAIIETVGGVNVAKNAPGQGDFVAVSLEEIIGWNPDVIYIPVYASYKPEDILNNRAWSSINAVKNGKVFAFPSALEPWDYPTPSVAIGLSWLLNNLYPNLYSMEQVLADARDYYQMIYGQSFSAQQLGFR